MKILLATGNGNKVKELQKMLDEQPQSKGWVVKSLRDFPDIVIPAEDAPDFLGNALIKARAAAKQTGLLTLADDSGLAVEALDGAPGVRSARYAGEDHDDAANNAKLLRAMAAVPAAKRTARFMCCIALVAPDGREDHAVGACEGRIALEPKGEDGFGYDPLFIVDGLNKTMAELTMAEKNKISHRGKALKEILPKINKI